MSVFSLERAHNAVREVVVHDVFEVNLIKIVGPWVQHAEALVLDALGSVLLDVGLQEFKV